MTAATNGVIFQSFHWYTANDGNFWNTLGDRARELAQSGFTAIWLPPAYKGSSDGDVGYGVYDLYDLGEFPQRGTTRTKYGKKDEYLRAIANLHQQGLEVYADVVLNHRLNGDRTEQPQATPYPDSDRIHPKGSLQQIESYTHFNFPGRQGRYSDFEWHWWHFDAVDYNNYQPQDRSTVYLLEGKSFDDYVALEKGNFAYLMGCDIDYQNPDVRSEIVRWGKWYLDTTKVDGFRLDAIKHISAWFFPEWLDAMEQHAGKQLFTVGEYWHNSTQDLQWYIDAVGSRMSVFDIRLHYNFSTASKAGNSYNLANIFDGTLVQSNPLYAVTFVENHDSQPLQALESVVEAWFKPLAYALILLREGGYPCVFEADYSGAEYTDKGRDGNNYQISLPAHQIIIDRLLLARKNYAHGRQHDYLDHPSTIGWTRLGTPAHPQAMAVIMSNGDRGYKWMEVGKVNTKFIDLTTNIQEPVITNADGWGKFICKAGSVSVWIESNT
jgi:alpha-amylase